MEKLNLQKILLVVQTELIIQCFGRRARLARPGIFYVSCTLLTVSIFTMLQVYVLTGLKPYVFKNDEGLFFDPYSQKTFY